MIDGTHKYKLDYPPRREQLRYNFYVKDGSGLFGSFPEKKISTHDSNVWVEYQWRFCLPKTLLRDGYFCPYFANQQGYHGIKF